jgi:hypothetical protein
MLVSTLVAYLVIAGNDGARDFLCDSSEVGVRLKLHVANVARLVIDDLHFACKKKPWAFQNWSPNHREYMVTVLLSVKQSLH